MVPLVKADVAVPLLDGFYFATGTFFLIPIILLEGTATYFLVKRRGWGTISIWSSFLIFLAANVLSTIIGYAVSTFIPYTVDYSPAIVFPIAFLLSILIEYPIIYGFIHKKLSTPNKNAFVISLLANSVSYLGILLLIGIGLFT